MVEDKSTTKGYVPAQEESFLQTASKCAIAAHLR